MKKILSLLFVLGLMLFSGCIQSNDNVPECSTDFNCLEDEFCFEGSCEKLEGNCGYTENHEWIEYECCEDITCGSGQMCSDHVCVPQSGCNYGNPSCSSDEECVDNECILKQGCDYNNPSCESPYECVDNECVVVCSVNSDCSSLEICSNERCISVECVEDYDCSDATYKCANNECAERNSCSYDYECGMNEVCISKQCYGVVDCTSGSCEDAFFALEDVLVDQINEEMHVKATITPKTFVRGNFRVVWNEPGFGGFLKSVEEGFTGNELDFWVIITKPTFQPEHYVLEHMGDPQIMYLVAEYE